jgi:hypothetical protein
MRSNAGQIAARMRARQAASQRELRTAARRIAIQMRKATTRVMRSRIYSVPIPRTRTGLPKWVRTGELLGKEAARADGVRVILSNPTGHAIPRYTLGTPAGRNIVSHGVQSVQWHREAIMQERGYILKERREALLRALRRS